MKYLYVGATPGADPEALTAVVPEPLEIIDSVVKYEFIRMPDSTGFGDYTETGQVIPVRLNGEAGAREALSSSRRESVSFTPCARVSPRTASS